MQLKLEQSIKELTKFGNKHRYLLTSLVFAIFTALFYYTAWVAEDAYITFRVVDNFLDGLGLRWNVHERVQVYTHPLWMFLISGLHLITPSVYFTAIFISLAFSIGLLAFLRFSFFKNNFSRFLILFFLLITSKAFVDFWWSGLENPLAYFLLAVFFFKIWKNEKTINSNNLLTLSFLGSLIILTRQDFVLLVAPSLAFNFYKAHIKAFQKFVLFIIGFFPLIAWEIFSVLYYGFPFPNTYYAKLHTGISSIALIHQGFRYLANSLHWDFITVAVIFVAIGLGIQSKRRPFIHASLGLLLYMFYIIKVGGDFMSGRFFSVPFFVGALMVVLLLPRKAIPALVCLLLGIHIFSSYAPTRNILNIQKYTDWEFESIGDERGSFYEHSGLQNYKRDEVYPDHEWMLNGLKFRESNNRAAIALVIGYFGYGAGPKKVIFDSLALGDPFLARLPVLGYWRIGHFQRKIPDGYTDSVLNGTSSIQSEPLKELYEKISLITRGPVFSRERLKAIWELNTGLDKKLISQWLKENPPAPSPQDGFLIQ